MQKPKVLCKYQMKSGRECGALAFAVVKVAADKITVRTKGGKQIGKGSASSWVPLCKKHSEKFPDHDGFEVA